MPVVLHCHQFNVDRDDDGDGDDYDGDYYENPAQEITANYIYDSNKHSLWCGGTMPVSGSSSRRLNYLLRNECMYNTMQVGWSFFFHVSAKNIRQWKCTYYV